LFLTGCTNEIENEVDKLIQLKSSEQTMHYGDEFQIQATSVTPIAYTSENEYHAKVSSSGLITAGRVGETYIVIDNGEDLKKIKVIVTPENNLYPEPELTFGMSHSDVKARLGNPDEETGSAMGYKSYSSNTSGLMCSFDKSDKLTSYVIIVKTSYTSKLTEFLLERYVPAALPDDGDIIAIFVNGLNENTSNMAVTMGIYNLSYIMVLYTPFPIPNPDTRSGVNNSDILKSIAGSSSEFIH
jgi:hypothetical protein